MEECSILGEYKTQQKQLENLNKNAEAYQLFSGSGECTYTWAGEGKSLFFFFDCETKRKRLGAGKNVECGDGGVRMRMEKLYLISRFPPSSSNALKSLSNIHQKLRCK